MSTTPAHATSRDLLKVAEVAVALRVSGETIRRRVADGTIRGVVLGRVIRIPRGELERLLDDSAHVVRRASSPMSAMTDLYDDERATGSTAQSRITRKRGDG
jgi:excisionase family DNA binding protein